MDFPLFAQLFDQQNVDLVASAALWDRRASEVSQFTLPVDDFAWQNVIQHIDLQGSSVLEVSFGAGRHLLQFLRHGAEVSGVEISSAMIASTTEKLQATGLDWQAEDLVHSSWEDISLERRQWVQAFDLVFMYMSPALSSTAMLQKALDASRRGVHISLYSHREDSLLQRLQQELGLQQQPIGVQRRDDIFLLFNILYGWGYFPQLQFEERLRTSYYQPDYVLERYASWLWRDGEPDEQDRRRLWQLLDQWGDSNGQVVTCSRDIVGHLWLDKGICR